MEMKILIIIKTVKEQNKMNHVKKNTENEDWNVKSSY